MQLTFENGRVVIHRIKKEQSATITKEYIEKSNIYNKQLIKLPQNDTGNARRVLLFCRDYVKFNISTGSWIIWDGKLWESQTAEERIKTLIQAVMDKYYDVVKNDRELDEPIKKTILYHARRSNDNNSIINILSLLKAMNYVKEMSCKSHYLNVQNGVVNLKTKELLPHRPEYGCTNICKCDYNPEAKSLRFKQFVREIMDFNKEKYSYLQVSSGYCITGTQKEQKLFVYLGNGANGKSKYLEAVAHTLNDYANVFPVKAILKSNSQAGSPTPELIPLINRRFTYSSELKSENVINDAFIKQITGNSKLPVRKMRQEFSNMDILFKIIIDTNNAPNFKHFDYAIKRRIVIIPFTRTFEGDNKDEDLKNKLFEDSEYILKWLIDGAYKYYNEGLKEPPIIANAIEDYCDNADSIGSFIKNAIVYEKDELMKSSVLYTRYSQYCFESGFSPVDIKSFSQSMQNRGFEKKIKNTGAYFKDIKLQE